jgi:shikimate dehydrogenase
MNIPFVYVAFDVVDLKNAVNGIRALGIRGVSVTIPHKTSVIKYLDRVEGIAKKIGAVNTIVNENNILTGYNTDATGISTAFREAGVKLRGKNCLILGSGGAARAAAFVLCEAGVGHLEILSIENAQLKSLVKDLKKHYNTRITGTRWTDESVRNAVASGEIIINATPVGMWPKTDDCPINPDLLTRGKMVFDVIYTPPITRLLAEAKKRGSGIISGVEMFVHQAAEQFRLFTGLDAPVKIIRKALKYKQ